MDLLYQKAFHPLDDLLLTPKRYLVTLDLQGFLGLISSLKTPPHHLNGLNIGDPRNPRCDYPTTIYLIILQISLFLVLNDNLLTCETTRKDNNSL